MRWGRLYHFGALFFLLCVFSSALSSEARATDCKKNLSSLSEMKKALNEVRDERKRLYDEFLSPGKLLSSNAFRTIVKRNELNPSTVIQDLFNSLQIEVFPADGTSENRQKNLTQFKIAEAKAKELGISLESFLELSDVVRKIKDSPRKEKEFRDLIANVLPEYGLAIKNRYAEMPWGTKMGDYHLAARRHDDGFPFWFPTILTGIIGSVAGPLVAAGNAQEGNLSVPAAWAIGTGVSLLSFALPTLFVEGVRQWKLLDWRKTRWSGWFQEIQFRSKWKTPPKEKLAASVTEEQEDIPIRDINITGPYTKVSQAEVPSLKFEGLTNEHILEFGEPLQQATHHLLEQTAARVTDLFLSSRSEEFDKVSNEIQRRFKVKGLSKLDAGKLVTSLLENIQKKSREHQPSLMSMKSDARVLDESLKAAITEIESIQIGIADRLSQEISTNERGDREEMMIVLERKKENLASALLAVQTTSFHLGRAIDSLGNQEQGLRKAHYSLHLGEGFDTGLNAASVEALVKDIAYAKSGLATETKIPSLVSTTVLGSEEKIVTPPRTQVREQ